jgi:threonine/homoserine/homoserine lactone efflux protein
MFWSFVLAATLIELTPGPNMTWLAVLGATRGRPVALSAVAGIALGLVVAATVAGVGLTALVIEAPALLVFLRWAGTLYLLYLAWDAWRDADGNHEMDGQSPWQGFMQGLVTNVLNPKAYLFYAAVLPQFISADAPPMAQIISLSATYIVIATVIHAGIALLAGSAARWLRTSPIARVIRRALALLIAATAVWFFYSTQVTQ